MNEDILFIKNNRENDMNNSKFKYKIFRLTISQYPLLLKLVGKLNRKSKIFLFIVLFCDST